MYYEINVSLNGYHFFATHERSLMAEREANKLYELFIEKFPPSEGYEISLRNCMNTSRQIKTTGKER